MGSWKARRFCSSVQVMLGGSPRGLWPSATPRTESTASPLKRSTPDGLRAYIPSRFIRYFRGLFQYGDLHLGQVRAGFGVLGYQICPQRPHSFDFISKALPRFHFQQEPRASAHVRRGRIAQHDALAAVRDEHSHRFTSVRFAKAVPGVRAFDA